MDKNKQEKDIIGDVHGSADKIKQALNDMGFTPDKAPVITLGSHAEKTPRGKLPDLSEFIEKFKKDVENRQKANDAHHDEQYNKMYPGKKK